LWSVAVFNDESNHNGSSIVAGNSSNDPISVLDAMDFASMSVEELWKLRETIEAMVAEKIAAEILVLRRYLDRLSPEASAVRRGSQKRSKAVDAKRRPYPQVLPKYRNPTQPSETWAGRGKQPRWVRMQLTLGTRLEDLVIR
jgi:DNA-binding protein H-NS